MKRNESPFTIPAAARYLGIGESTAYDWLEEGRFKEAQTQGSVKMVTAASVYALEVSGELDRRRKRLSEGQAK